MVLYVYFVDRCHPYILHFQLAAMRTEREQELQTANTRAERAQQQVQQLQQQVSDIIQNSCTINYSCALPSQLAGMCMDLIGMLSND